MDTKISADSIKNADPNVCFVDHVKNVSDKHHIVPVEYGGPETGLTVPLCPTCHRNIHREAQTRFKKNEEGKYINEENYPDESAYNRARALAEYVLQSQLRFVAKGEKKAEGARNMSQISWERDELAMAHDVKRMLGMKSMERMLKLLVFERWRELKKNGK